MQLDEVDLKILKILQTDAKYPLEKIAEEVRAPKSTVAYRIKRLEKSGVIRGYYAYIDPASLNLDYLVVTLVKAKYGKDYHEILGQKIAQLSGVWGVYFVLGENDFIVLARFRNRDEMMSKYLEKLMSMPEIERTNTQIIAKIIRETPFYVLD
ncbi:Lrp/AsnC family transcriptional regulator [Stygiolobus azoricus]|uniref:Winged helix-turn-helix transcriptional regulator n=1 Tax=Stygiolobus azoricus TaxID=41675 RepID=A0A650CP88_9CREN|nr:Lrp/AsnC family transcriptional regulator [Stygiolobus azoricus]QGR19583.1 winged helix-turn-helix transcriptional regulator [Stygiolobus azoricus]